MPSRRKSPARKPTPRAPASARPGSEPRPERSRRSEASTDAATRRWRRDVRPQLVSSAVSATEALRWSPALINVLLEELYVDEAVQELLGKTPNELRGRDYPQAVAVALILRHSWRADDLASILERLGIT